MLSFEAQPPNSILNFSREDWDQFIAPWVDQNGDLRPVPKKKINRLLLGHNPYFEPWYPPPASSPVLKPLVPKPLISYAPDRVSFTTIEAAPLIGIRPGTLNAWRSKGKGPLWRYAAATSSMIDPKLKDGIVTKQQTPSDEGKNPRGLFAETKDGTGESTAQD